MLLCSSLALPNTIVISFKPPFSIYEFFTGTSRCFLSSQQQPYVSKFGSCKFICIITYSDALCRCDEMSLMLNIKKDV